MALELIDGRMPQQALLPQITGKYFLIQEISLYITILFHTWSLLVQVMGYNSCYVESNIIDLTVHNIPLPAPTIGTITQPTCTTPTGRVVLNNLPVSYVNWTLTRYTDGIPDGTTYSDNNASFTVTPLPAGHTYTFTVAVYGCISVLSNPVVISTAAGAPDPPIIGTITQPTCALGTGSVILNDLPPTGTWTLRRTPGNVTTTGSGISRTISGLAPGTYTYTVTDASGCTSGSSGNVVINSAPTPPFAPAVVTIIQPTCDVSTGSVILNGLPSSGTWTLTRSPGNVTTSGTGTSYTISGLTAGTYTYTVTDAIGCTSGSSGNVAINTPVIPTTPVVSLVTQPTCDVATGTIGLSSLPGTGTWTLTRNPGGITSTGTGTTTTVSGLTADTYTFFVTNSVACTSGITGNIIIISQPSPPAAPTASTTLQPTCTVATGTIVITDPIGAYQYNLDGGAYQASATFSGVASGPHNILVRRTGDNTCISSPTSVTVDPQPVTPLAPAVGTITIPTCALATGSVVLNGLPAGNWTINPGAISGSGSSSTVSGLAPATYNFTVTNSVGCISPASANVVITGPVYPSAPLVGTITQPTCTDPTGSVILSGLPATGTWTLTRTPGGVTTTGSGTNTTISGLPTGTYTYTVADESGCTSTASGNVVINAQPVTPSAPTIVSTIQPTCALATGSVKLGGLPSGNWTVTRTPGNVNTSGSGASPTIPGVPPGTYTYTVRNAAGCTSTASPSVTVNAPPTPPAAATASTTIQPTCALATGTIVITAPIGAYEYNIDGGTYQASTTFAGVSSGSHIILVRSSADNTCISSPATVSINAQPSPPAAATVTTTQPTCTTATGTIVVTNPLGFFEYNIDGGTWQASVTFSGVVAGSHNILVRNASDNSCISSPASITVNAQPETPTAPAVGTITQPTCGVATGSVVLNNLPAGNWTINPGAIAGNTINTTISGLASGTHNFTVTNAAGCISPLSANVAIIAQPIPPATATLNTTQPTCTVATATIVVSAPLGAFEYNIDGGTWQASMTFAGVLAGSHNILVRSTSDNSCISSPASVTIITQPVTPTAPAVGTITQPSCAVATGSVILNNLPAGNWTINPGAIAGNTLSATVSGLTSDTYNFTVTNAAGCTSPASANVIIVHNLHLPRLLL